MTVTRSRTSWPNDRAMASVGSLMVGDLSRQGILDRHEDDTDRRRRIVSITPTRRRAIKSWLGRGANAWKQALAPLTPHERQVLVAALRSYEAAMGDDP